MSAECASEKSYWNRSIIGKDMDKSKVPRFYGPPCTYDLHHNFGRALTVKKFNPNYFFSQFKHCYRPTSYTNNEAALMERPACRSPSYRLSKTRHTGRVYYSASAWIIKTATSTLEQHDCGSRIPYAATAAVSTIQQAVSWSETSIQSVVTQSQNSTANFALVGICT